MLAVITVANSPPSVPLFAQAVEENASSVLIEEFYRESDITFYGRDPVACSAGGGTSGGVGGPANITVDQGFSLGTEPMERRVNLAKALMRDYQLSAAQAAGIIGNFMQESGGAHLPPNVNQGDTQGAPPQFSGGYGWAQWTGPRQEAFINFAVSNGYMASDGVEATDAANYAWLKEELNTTYQSTITELKKLQTPGDAAFSFHKTFEKSADSRSQIAEREASAVQVFNEIIGGGGTGAAPVGVAPPGASGSCGSVIGGGAAIVGEYAFPLKTTRAKIDQDNGSLFANGTVKTGEHPYTAYDIFADQGTPILAFFGGTVERIGSDKCGGDTVGIYNAQSDLIASHLHMGSVEVQVGQTVQAGQQVGTVGTSAGDTCGTPPHLHIDVANGNSRPGCKREDCPPENAAQFVDVGPQLFETYEALP